MRFLTLLGVFLAAASITAQWVKQSPYPTSSDLQAVFFVTPDIGFISGDDSALLKTADGGVTWTQAPETNRPPWPGLGDSIWDMQFLDANNGYAMGNPLRSYKTTNGGQTWQVITVPIGPLGMDFVSVSTGIVFDRRSAYRTTNGGSTWTESIADSLDHFIMDMDFFNANVGLAVGEISEVIGVYRSTNFGQSWTKISNQDLDRVLYLTQNNLVATKNAAFYRSTDGGVTWTPEGGAFNPNSQTDIEAITKVSDTSAAAVAFDHSIWMTFDSGDTWQKVKEPTGVWGFELDIHFVTPQVGYSAGRAGLVFKTTDGGMTWTQINNGGARHIEDIQMQPSGRGLAVGFDGLVLRTTDYGNKWTAMQMRGEGEFWHIGNLHTVEFITDNTVVVGGESGRVFRSEDGGVTWTQQLELGGNADVLDTFFINENEGWIASILNAPRGSIEYTNNGGKTWTRVVDGDPYPTRLHMFDANAGLALIRPYSQLRTADKFFNVSVESLTQNDQWIDMEFVGDHGWYAGVSGTIMRTTDRGQTRVPSNLPSWEIFNDAVSDLDALSQQRILVATRRTTGLGSGRIFESTNGGQSWSLLPVITTPESATGSLLLAMDALEGGPIWAASHLGYIFRLGNVVAPIHPTSYTLIRGTIVQGNTLVSVLHSDDQRMVLRPGITLSATQDPAVVEFSGTSPLTTASELRLVVETSASSSTIQVKAEMYDYDAEAWVQIAAFPSTTTDTVHEFVRTDANRWIAPSGEVKCRISYRAVGPVLALPWSGRIDQIKWQVQ